MRVFYNSFKDCFVTRADAVKELECRLDKVYFLNEFLEEGKKYANSFFNDLIKEVGERKL